MSSTAISSAAAGLFDRIADTVSARAPARDAVLTADARADDLTRSVTLSAERVTIDRRYRGIAMRLSVPLSSYRGVSVGVRMGEQGGFVYELHLLHRDPELSILLADALDETVIWAEWRAAAAHYGLPALVERNDGPEAWGAMATRAQDGREGHARRAKHRRRPGIVARRAARPEALGTVHREAEMIARD